MVTLLQRPYVFIFLLAFIGIAGRHLGWRRMLAWLVSGYAIALASEASSIRNGFPYGTYHYVYENLRGEWLLLGVPVWDSLSYPFMIYAGYAMAMAISITDNRSSSSISKSRIDSRFRIAFVGALFTMILDIIIDPLTILGDRWFLGRVYYYPHGGQYFGVPLTNFAGWFLVPLAVIMLNQRVWRLPTFAAAERVPPVGKHRATMLGALFYCSIACFNIGITLWIREWSLGVTSMGWFLSALSLPYFFRRSINRRTA